LIELRGIDVYQPHADLASVDEHGQGVAVVNAYDAPD